MRRFKKVPVTLPVVKNSKKNRKRKQQNNSEEIKLLPPEELFGEEIIKYTKGILVDPEELFGYKKDGELKGLKDPEEITSDPVNKKANEDKTRKPIKFEGKKEK